VPIVDINAGFPLADFSWFEDEQTLFVFYRVEAEQGIGPESLIELRYTTDQVDVPWTSLNALTPVHTHLPVDCGPNTRCGSLSVKVEQVPRSVGLRLRYHRDGALSLDADAVFNVVASGPPHLTRSLVVYGVFDETNTLVQWRARHQFPTVRNQQAQELGLRRTFSIDRASYGDLTIGADNPYGYGLTPACPAGLSALNWPQRMTSERAVFETTPLPLTASAALTVCAAATVTDAVGTFTTTAVARKNPQVKPAFPVLRSPIRENSPIRFLVRPCNRVISQEHLEMQLQRLLLLEAPTLCTDDFATPSFVDTITATIKARVDAERRNGKDMLLVMAIHQDDSTGRLNAAIEQVLERILVPEREKSSPRVSGAFLFDSAAYRLTIDALRPLVLWCPSRLASPFDLDSTEGPSERDCALQPDLEFMLGPARLTQLAILPTRDQYLKFIQRYSVAQAGTVKKLSFFAPERTAVSENAPVGEVGVLTKLNNEIISAGPDDAFSFCSTEDQGVARIAVQPVGVPSETIPLSALPAFHAQSKASAYALAVFWESSFIVKMDYETRTAIGASVLSLTLALGIANSNQRFLGNEQWKRDSFSLADSLAQCTRFCDHPTFDSAGVYQPSARFRQTYAQQCYRPLFPVLGNGGFPSDP
jgi:hypothetical protein